METHQDQGPSCPVIQFGWMANSWKSPGGSKLLEATELLGKLKALGMVRYPCPDLYLTTILLQRSTVFLGLHGLVFVLTCSVNCGTLQRHGHRHAHP